MKTITCPELAAKLASSARPILIEALPARYFQQGHLPGALNLNVDEVRAKANTLLADKTADIVVYCASPSCNNSDQVAVQLSALGYTQVSVFKGGKSQWQEAGHALESSP